MGSSGTMTGLMASFCLASLSSLLRFRFSEPRAPRNWTGLLLPLLRWGASNVRRVGFDVS